MGPHIRISWWAKSIAMHFAVAQMSALQCILQLPKCPPADAHVHFEDSCTKSLLGEECNIKISQCPGYKEV
jgi:hypothetical protein